METALEQALEEPSRCEMRLGSTWKPGLTKQGPAGFTAQAPPRLLWVCTSVIWPDDHMKPPLAPAPAAAAAAPAAADHLSRIYRLL